MKSLLVKWFLDMKFNITLSESRRKNLPVLNLRCHMLEKCPNLWRNSPEYVESLKCLLMQHNSLTTLTRSYCHFLKSLKALTLDYNQLYDLPFDIRHFKNLSILNVSYNKFSDGHFFLSICQITSLKVLWANSTGIKEIPPEITALQKLQTLGLRHNSIKCLPEEISSLVNLKWLTLSNNNIGSLPKRIGNLKNIVHLNVSYNHLVTVPTTLVMLQELQYLHLNHNFLVVDHHLRLLISNIPKLVKCCLHANLQDSETEEYIDEIVGTGGDSAGLTPRSVSRPSSSTEVQTNGNDTTSTSFGIEENQLRERLEGVYCVNRGGNESLNNNYVTISEVDCPCPCGNNEESELEDEMENNSQVEEIETDTEIVTVFKNRSQFSKCRQRQVSDTMEAMFLDKDHDLTLNDNNNNENPTDAITNASNVPFTFLKSPEEKLSSQILKDDDNDNIVQLPQILSENQNDAFPSSYKVRTGKSQNENGLHKLSSVMQTEAWVITNNNRNSSDSTHSIHLQSRYPSDLLKKIEKEAETIIEEAAGFLSMSKQLHNKSSLISTSSRRNNEPKIIPGFDQLTFHCRRSQSSVAIIRDPPMASMITQMTSTHQQCTNSVDAEYSDTSEGNENNELRSNEDEPDGNNNAANFIQTQKNSTGSEEFTDSPSQSDSSASSLLNEYDAPIIEEAALLYGTDSMTLSSSLSLGLDSIDVESNYDKSDWENSTPSSIIDDQDIMSRFSDFQDVLDDRYSELDDEFPLLHDIDLRGIVRCLISML